MATPQHKISTLKGLTVKLQAIQEAAECYGYIHVQANDKAPSNRTPTGMKMVWRKRPDDVFDPLTRLSGDYDAVYQAIEIAGINEDLQGLESRIITIDNYETTMAHKYNEECDAFLAYKSTHKKPEVLPIYSWESLEWMLADYKHISLSSSEKSATTTKTARRGARGSSQSLKAKFLAMGDGKFMDLTHFVVSEMKGASIIKSEKVPLGAIKADKRTRKRYIDGIPILCTPENAEAYKYAVTEIYGAEEGKSYYAEWKKHCDETVFDKVPKKTRAPRGGQPTVIRRTTKVEQTVQTPTMTTARRSASARSRSGSPRMSQRASPRGSPTTARRAGAISPAVSPVPVVGSPVSVRSSRRRGRSQKA